MPLDLSRMVLKGHLTSADMKQYGDLLLGDMVDQAVHFANALQVDGALDAPLLVPTGHTVEQRNAANPQIYRLYNTYTDPSNYERAQFVWSGNQFTISTIKAGSGTNRNLRLNANGAELHLGAGAGMAWKVAVGGEFQAITDNLYDIGAQTDLRPRNLHVANAVYAPQLGSANNVDVNLVSNGMARWKLTNAGHIAAVTDYTYDLGTFSNRPRDTHLGRDIYLGVGSTFSRIRTPLSQSTNAQRTLWQSSVSNGMTAFGIMPNGTSQASGFNAYGKADDVDNAPYMAMWIDSGQSFLDSGKLGTGTTLPLQLRVGGTARIVIGTDGMVDMPTHRLRVSGWGTPPTSGQGLELGYNSAGPVAFITSYDRAGAGAFLDLNISGKVINIIPGGDLNLNPGGKLVLPDQSVNALLGTYQSTPTFSTTALSAWTATPVAVTFTTSGRRLRVEVQTLFHHSVANAQWYVGLGLDGGLSPYNGYGYYTGTVALLPTHAVQTYYIPLGAGTHTLTVLCFNATAGTLTQTGTGFHSLYVTEQKA